MNSGTICFCLLPPCNREVIEHVLIGAFISNIWQNAPRKKTFDNIDPWGYLQKGETDELEKSFNYINQFKGDQLPPKIRSFTIQEDAGNEEDENAKLFFIEYYKF